MRTRILLVEDEGTIAETLAESLGRDGFEAEVAATLADAREAIRREPPDLVLLDVMLPDGDGRDLAREIRQGSDVPIVLLTARGEEIDRVLGLELGADDYVVKPFSSRELTARIRAVMRRGRAREQRSPLEIGALRLDPTSRTVTETVACVADTIVVEPGVRPEPATETVPPARKLVPETVIVTVSSCRTTDGVTAVTVGSGARTLNAEVIAACAPPPFDGCV